MIQAQTIDERRGCTSASNAAADLLCQGRHLAQAGRPRSQSAYSETGDRIHNALATGNRDGLTSSEADTVERCLEIERHKLIEFFGPEDAPKARAFREIPSQPERSRLWVKVATQGGQVYEHSCRPDVFYRLLDRALVIEYKGLFGDVPASPRNQQLRDQQVIIRGNFMIGGDIGVVVIQPGVESDPQICVYTAEDSKVAEAEMFARVVASNQPNAPRTPGEEQCKFCLAKKVCEPYIKWAGAMVPSVLNLMEVPMDLWEPRHLAAAAGALKPARDLLDAIEAHIKDLLAKDPASCPGWFLKPGNVTEAIVNPQGCFERFAKLGGTVEQFMVAVKVTKGALRTAVSTVTGTKGKRLDTVLAQMLDGLTESKQNAPSLKPSDEADERLS